MKRIVMLAAIITFVLVTASAWAEDATGTWKWTIMFNNNTREGTAKLKQEGEKLTGVYIGGQNNTETPIEEGSVKENVVSFKIVREFNGNKFTIKYSGTLKDDTIKGKSSFDVGGQNQERDWEAKRQK